ncbi:MAG: ATP synthase F1 subunit epsilon [Candidatus Uhrbacteria bacterium]|nr:ATP synthase F1 subunit epsilon [Candidatus Uhrbacteria bacterium]MDP3794269.1 ATP synthase F1 subunit epsilon [Candidatus Uhrbacteria bacterium]
MIHFCLVTPDRVLADEEVLSISLPTVEGELTILPHHAELTALLVPGIIKIKKSGKNVEEEVAVSGGFIHVTKDRQAIVLADTAERGHELEISVMEEAKKRAQEVMRQAVTKDDVSFAAAAAALERELARYKVASRHHHGHKKNPAGVGQDG